MADYSIEDKEEMIKANVARLNAHKSRLQELIEFIKVSGFQKIGIANCLSMQKYADKLAEILRSSAVCHSCNAKARGYRMTDKICKILLMQFCCSEMIFKFNHIHF